MLRVKVIFLAVFILSFGMKAFSQTNNCSEVLMKAQETYKDGRISEIADMLHSCLENGFTKAEKIEAYRVLTLTYLYFNEHDKAIVAMTDLLKNDPEYKLRPSDPTEFVNLYNSFRTTPVFLVGGKFGVNATDIDVKKNFSLDNSAEKRGSYKSNVGIQGGLVLQFPLAKKLSLLTELQYKMYNYSYSDYLFGYASLNYSEKQARIGVPVLLNYNIGKNPKWVPYLNIGASLDYLIQAKAVPIRVDETGGQNKREIKEGEIVVSDLRKKLNFNVVAGGGLKVKNLLSRGYLFLDLRYSYGLNNVVNPKKRYSNDDLIYKYFYVDNDFKINSFQYSVGYIYPIYKPKLKKVKSVEE